MKKETKSHFPEFVKYDLKKNMYEWKCRHCKKSWLEPVDHSCILQNSELYDGYKFLCEPEEDCWWFKRLNESELAEIKKLPEKKLRVFINKMNKLKESETKFAGIRNWKGVEKVSILNRTKLQIIDPMDIIKML